MAYSVRSVLCPVLTQRMFAFPGLWRIPEAMQPHVKRLAGTPHTPAEYLGGTYEVPVRYPAGRWGPSRVLRREIPSTQLARAVTIGYQERSQQRHFSYTAADY
eukprot:3215753-Rhodomonas_salina.1